MVSKKEIARRLRLSIFHNLERFIPHDNIWEAFASTFWNCPLCGGKLDPVTRCPTPNCWNHLVKPEEKKDPHIWRGSVDGDAPILGIECPRCEFEESQAPLCHKCQKEVK